MKHILFLFSAMCFLAFSVTAQRNQEQLREELKSLTPEEQQAFKNIRKTLMENRSNAALLKVRHSTLTQNKTDYFIQLVSAAYPSFTQEQLDALAKSVGRHFIQIEYRSGIVTEHEVDFNTLRAITEKPTIIEGLLRQFTDFETAPPRVGFAFLRTAFQGNQAAAQTFRDELGTWMNATVNQFGG